MSEAGNCLFISAILTSSNMYSIVPVFRVFIHIFVCILYTHLYALYTVLELCYLQRAVITRDECSLGF